MVGERVDGPIGWWGSVVLSGMSVLALADVERGHAITQTLRDGGQDPGPVIDRHGALDWDPLHDLHEAVLLVEQEREWHGSRSHVTTSGSCHAPALPGSASAPAGPHEPDA